MYPTFSRSYKNRFPFRLGTTSFIYPDHYAKNVEMLAPFFDEIELLFFESRFDNSLPSKTLIQTLKNLAEKHGISYNIHLPVDISLGDAGITHRMHAVDTINRFIERTQLLSPTTSTLHLVQPMSMNNKSDMKVWLESLYWSMERVIGKEIKGEDLSIENLFYPLTLIKSLIDDFQLSVCLDIGHIVLSKQDIENNFDEWREKITIVHLHGVDGEKDHLGLDQMPLAQLEKIMIKLHGFTGVVSLEVFSFSKLHNSMEILKNFLDL